MAQTITVNQNKGSRGAGILVVRSDASGFISTSGNAPADSKANTAGETISAMNIAELAWSCASGATWTVKRGNGVGANTVWVTHGTSGFLDFAASQMRLEQSGVGAANVSFTLAGGAGQLILKMHKSSGE